MDDENNLYHDFSDWDPDFNFQEFRSNFVARWEYKTGSNIYFVWTNYRTQLKDEAPSVFRSLKDVASVKSQNAFMIKVSYWFSL